MNLIFATSVLESLSGTSEHARPPWREELLCLSLRNRLFLWSEGKPSSLPEHFAEVRNQLDAFDLVPDETALVGNSVTHIQAARSRSIPCYAISADPAQAERLRQTGAEAVFPDLTGLIDAVWKTNSVERRLFPVVTVGGLLRDEAGAALFVRTRKWSNKWGIPGGKVEYGETLEAAFRREIAEETGLVLTQCRLVMAQDCIEHPEFFRPRHFVLMNYLAEVSGHAPAVRLNHEGVDYLWTPLPESLGLDLNGPTRILVERVLGGGRDVWTA